MLVCQVSETRLGALLLFAFLESGLNSVKYANASDVF